MTNELKGGDQSARVVEVAISLLSVHSKQAELSPEMRDKDWTKFLAGIKKNGILQPLSVTRGNRVIDGKNRLKAARQLGFENVRVVYEDIPEDEIATFITETKLSRDDLKRGQRAAIVINLYYEIERERALERKSLGGQGGIKEDSPEMGYVPTTGKVAEELAKKAGIGRSSMEYLIAVKRSRPDLFEKVFSGEYAIGRAHAEMKRDEAPETVEPTGTPIEVERKAIEAVQESESSLPQIDESQPSHSLDNRLVQMRKNALSLTIEVLDESDKMHEARPEVKDSARSQLLALTRSCVLALGQTTEDEDDAELLAVVHELLNKLNGGN